jgi:hypothetical protein
MIVNIENVGSFKFYFDRTGRGHTAIYCEFEGVTFSSAAHLAKNDKFCKATGRRVALTRMLKNGLNKIEPCEPTAEYPSCTARWAKVHEFTREERRIVWAEYFARHSDLGKKSSSQFDPRVAVAPLSVKYVAVE